MRLKDEPVNVDELTIGELRETEGETLDYIKRLAEKNNLSELDTRKLTNLTKRRFREMRGVLAVRDMIKKGNRLHGQLQPCDFDGECDEGHSAPVHAGRDAGD